MTQRLPLGLLNNGASLPRSGLDLSLDSLLDERAEIVRIERI